MTAREQLAQFAAGSKALGRLCREYKNRSATVHLEELVGGALSFYAAAAVEKTGGVHLFVAEDREVLRAGLASAPWISVDDTGALHAGRNGVTTQIGDGRFTAFRTSRSKSRTNFLDCLRAGHTDYVVDETALAYTQGITVEQHQVIIAAAQDVLGVIRVTGFDIG